MLKLIIISFLICIATAIWSCLVVSSKCSRMEEENERRNKR